MFGLARQWGEEGRVGWPSASAAPADPSDGSTAPIRILLARVLPSMVARGLGLDTLCLYLSIARAALLALVMALDLPTPHDRPHRRAGGRNAWVPGDVGCLIELWMEGWRAASLAERFGRTPGAIWSKTRQLGLPKRDRKSLFRPTDPKAPRPVVTFPLATRAFDAAALQARSGDPAPRLKPLVPAAAPAAPAAAEAGAAGLTLAEHTLPVVAPAVPARGPGLPSAEESAGEVAADVAISGQDGTAQGGPAGQASLAVVLFGPESRAPATISLIRPAAPNAPRPVATFPLATLAFDAAALGRSLTEATLPIVAPAAPARGPGFVSAVEIAGEVGQNGRAQGVPAGQASLPVVLSGPESPAPAVNGRHCGGLLIRVKPESIAPLPLRVAEIVAEHAAANPVASAAVKAIRKHLVRAASESLAVINRRVRRDGRIECEWSPVADIAIGYCQLSGQHDVYSSKSLGVSVSCLRTRKWVTEAPHQIRGETVEAFNPAWAEEVIDAWDLRLQQCHAYRDIKGVNFWFWAKKGDGRIHSKRAKSKIWFQERASSGDYAY